MVWLNNNIPFTIICRCSEPESSFLSDAADIAQVVIAGASLFLAYVIYQYQKKDRVIQTVTEKINNEKNVKLQGFKEFVVTPNFSHLELFFDQLLTLKQQITVTTIDDPLAIQLNSFVKSEVSKFRINFNDAILGVNRTLFDSIKLKIENLNDLLIQVISDGHFDLTDAQEFEQLIGYPIRKTKNDVVALLVTYEGD